MLLGTYYPTLPTSVRLYSRVRPLYSVHMYVPARGRLLYIMCMGNGTYTRTIAYKASIYIRALVNNNNNMHIYIKINKVICT